MSMPNDSGRRDFLKKAVAASTVTIAPGVILHTMNAEAEPRTQPVTDKVRWGMLIDTTKCADGCKDCVEACNKENGLDLVNKPEGASDELWERQRPHWIRQVKLKDNMTGRVTNLPMMCQHCEFPPCVDVCPTGASFKRADGIVMVDRHICIGCRYCMMACPYKARSFIHAEVAEKLTHAPRGKGCVEACNLCVHRLDNGQTTTACQDACKHQAIVFGDLKDPESPVSKALKKYPSVQIRADLKLNTGVRYTNI
ncbi:sulfate reduction electron transfer complex DsrMKJOP subunit DsrO [Thiolapillus sp.]